MKKINVIFANRKNCFELSGGDTIQMLKTKEYLEKKYPDISIQIVTTVEEFEKIQDADILHIFNIQTINETLNYLNAAKKKKIKTALSPIYWDLQTYNFIEYWSKFTAAPIFVPKIIEKCFIKFINFIIITIPFLRNKHKNGIDKGLYLSKKNKQIGNYILKNVDLILPNSPEELQCLSEYFEVSMEDMQKKTVCVPNATIFPSISDNTYNFTGEYEFINSLDNIVIEAGRIEPCKNQLGLIKALYKDSKIPIILVGKIANEKYYNHVMSLANKRGNVYHLNSVEQNVLFELYKKSSIHVLASLRESPGLVSLEAKACGCEIVVSNEKYCPIKYYEFDKLAHVCNPCSIQSIRNAIYDASDNKLPHISDKYRELFSYENAAKKTYEGYQLLFEQLHSS